MKQLTATTRSDVEHWLLRRGVPHLVANYTARERIWTRARPILIIALVMQVFLVFGDRFTGWTQLLVFLIALAVVGTAWLGFRRWRGMSPFDTRGGVGWQQLAFFVLVPTAVSALAGIGIAWTMAVVALGNLAFLGLVYVVVGFGLLPLTRWALGTLGIHLLTLTRLLARTLPVVLVLTVFMFINAEIWQVALLAHWTAVVVACGLLAVIGTLFIAISADDVVDAAREATLDPDEAEAYLVGTPLEGFKPSSNHLDLDRSARINLRLVVVFSIGVQIVLVGLLIAATYVGFGLLLVPFEVLELWGSGSGVEYNVLAEGEMLGFPLTLTAEHLAVSALVATMSGLSVAASAVTDDAYARTFTVQLHRELRQSLVVARTYQAHVSS